MWSRLWGEQAGKMEVSSGHGATGRETGMQTAVGSPDHVGPRELPWFLEKWCPEARVGSSVPPVPLTPQA